MKLNMKAIWVLFALPIYASATPGDYTIRSKTNGAWSNPETWQPKRTPTTGDKVLIKTGTHVNYDATGKDIIHSIRVAGRFTFARDRSTQLNVCMIKIQPLGHHETQGAAGVEDVHDHQQPKAEMAPAVLEVGSPTQPIPHPHVARIRLHFIDGMDPEEAPAIVCRPGGRMEFHGAPMNRTWVELTEDAPPGRTSVTLAEQIRGWRVGDEIVLTGANRDYKDEPGSASERRRITEINGRVVTIDRPLQREHSGELGHSSEVANLSRTVVVESATPKGVRGHTMYHRYSQGAISYARFESLGKAGVLGRYPIHFHRLQDSLRGSSVVGAAVIDSFNRWITVHGTYYMVVRDCVGYRSEGHGFFLEDGTEVYNVFDRNLGIGANEADRLPDQVLTFDPNDGAAFWWSNGQNTFIRNSACENYHYGYRYDSQKRSNFDSFLKVRQPDGSHKIVDIRTIPIFRFEQNESHSEGLYAYAFAGTDGVGPDTQHPHHLKNITAWNVHYALRTQIPTMLIEHVDIHHAAYGVYRPYFLNHVYRNVTITETGTEPFNRGLDDRSSQHGSITVDGLTFNGGPYGRRMPLIQISANNLSGRAASHFRRVKVNRSPRNHMPVVNLGGGPRLKPATPKGVPVYLHDWYGKGRHAKVVSTRATYDDGLHYREDQPLTGDESRVAEVTGIEFPELLNPIDDQPPATVITWPRNGLKAQIKDGHVLVRGTTTDNSATKRVLVNGIEATDTDFNFHQWTAVIPDVKPGSLVITALAEDASGNVEQTAHRIEVMAQ